MNSTAADRILAIDVGAGTQDILLYDPARTPEDCFRMVMPSQTQIVASRIRAVTDEKRPLHLNGRLMGGGASTEAILAHLAAGMPVTATPEAAATIHNNPDRVARTGVTIASAAPAGAAVVTLGDIDLDALGAVFAQFGIAMPEKVAIAVQDHGYRPGAGNNEMRFDYLQSLLDAGGDLSRMVFTEAPAGMTRMQAVLETIGGGIVMDTGAAAVLGALGDPLVRRHAEDEGVILVNLGNMHTFATLLKGRRLYGLFEHHTGGITLPILADLIERLQRGDLDTAQFMAGFDGHGASIHPHYRREGPFHFVATTGPNRAIARELRYHEAAPFGDMMLTGAFGLVEACLMRETPARSLAGYETA
jgi:uncharacterized protein (DUF1786 family)